jgi:hypothetical protein
MRTLLYRHQLIQQASRTNTCISDDQGAMDTDASALRGQLFDRTGFNGDMGQVKDLRHELDILIRLICSGILRPVHQ